jgi:pimeloyl-ACP methyl ester carboxylesterase
MPWIPNSPAIRWLASVSSLASAILPSRSETSFSSTGVSWRHGPHQAAQKSTSTGSSRERSITSCSKVASEVSKITPPGYGAAESGRPPWVTELTIDSGGVRLSGEESGEGTPVVLLHGLTATRRYVVMGSRNLERGGHRVVAYDARGHGRSGPADAYGYDALAGDLLAVLDDRGIDRAVLAGASMGAHTALRFALAHPDRAAALVVITPGFDPDGERGLDRWDALSRGLREGGVDGFVAAYGEPRVADALRDTVRTVLRQRLSAHEHPDAVADALAAVPRSSAFGAWDELAALDLPVTVVASRDEADPEHPYAIAERYAATIPGARLVSEEPGKSPLAWQGGQLSRVIAETAERA